MVRKVSTQYEFFVNGSLVSSGVGPPALPQDNIGVLYMGSASQTNYAQGKIDDVRIYDRGLSNEEIFDLFTAEVGPHTGIMKAVQPTFWNLTITNTYQLQTSANLVEGEAVSQILPRGGQEDNLHHFRRSRSCFFEVSQSSNFSSPDCTLGSLSCKTCSCHAGDGSWSS